jgi:hypothetical protein
MAFRDAQLHLSYCKVLLSVTETLIAPLWGPTRSLSTALCVTTDEGLAIRYCSVVVYHLPHKKHANCTLLAGYGGSVTLHSTHRRLTAKLAMQRLGPRACRKAMETSST